MSATPAPQLPVINAPGPSRIQKAVDFWWVKVPGNIAALLVLSVGGLARGKSLTAKERRNSAIKASKAAAKVRTQRAQSKKRGEQP